MNRLTMSALLGAIALALVVTPQTLTADDNGSSPTQPHARVHKPRVANPTHRRGSAQTHKKRPLKHTRRPAHPLHRAPDAAPKAGA